MGYYQISLASKSKGVTSFCTPFGPYEFNNFPMGISVESQALRRVVDEFFADLIGSYVFNFLDDLLVYSSSSGEHVTYVRKFLSRLQISAFTLNTDNVVLGASEFKNLGHLMSAKGLISNPIW